MNKHKQTKWTNTNRQNGQTQTDKMDKHKQTKWANTNRQNEQTQTDKMDKHKQTNGQTQTDKMDKHKQTIWTKINRQNGQTHIHTYLQLNLTNKQTIINQNQQTKSISQTLTESLDENLSYRRSSFVFFFTSFQDDVSITYTTTTNYHNVIQRSPSISQPSHQKAFGEILSVSCFSAVGCAAQRDALSPPIRGERSLTICGLSSIRVLRLSNLTRNHEPANYAAV